MDDGIKKEIRKEISKRDKTEKKEEPVFKPKERSRDNLSKFLGNPFKE